MANENQPAMGHEGDSRPHEVTTSADAAPATRPGGDQALESFCREMIRQQDYSAARMTADDILGSRSNTLGRDHPATLEAARLLGEALHGLGAVSDVRLLAEEMLALLRQLRGADDPHALMWQKVLTDALRALSEARESVQLAEDLLARCRRVFGDEHENTFAAETSLAAALYADHDFDGARSVAESVWQRRIRVQGADHPDALNAAEFLSHTTGPSLAGYEKRSQAGQIALDTLARRERVLGHSDTRTVTCRRLISNLQGFAAMYDPAGMAYARTALDDRSRAAADCAPFAIQSFIRKEGVLRTSLADPVVATEVAREANAQIIEEVRRLVEHNDPLTVLVCARRVSRQWIRQFLEQALNPSLSDATMRHVEREYPLLAANIALEHPSLEALERPPHTTATLLDGLRIALLCALHRVHSYLLNTEVRRATFDSTWEPSLIESYVLRADRASDVKFEALAAAETVPDETVTGLTSREPAGTTTITVTAPEELGAQRLRLENFLPVTISAERDRRWKGYLEHPDAASHLGGLTFDQWWSYWMSLNAVAYNWTQQHPLPLDTDASTPQGRERLRVCCEVQNLGMVEVVRSRLRDAVQSARHNTTFLPDEYDAFIDSLSWHSGAQKSEFLESPSIFYPSGQETMFWDLLRHGGVLSGLSRRASGKRGGIGNFAGLHFERRVHAALEHHPAVSALRSDVTISTAATGRQEVQIDHGFLVGDTLILLESKSFVKNSGYFVAHKEGFERRAKKIVEIVLDERDAKLRDLASKMAKEWAPANPKHAVYVICATEVEYIPSEDPAFWLDRTRDIPRICTLDELLTWLSHMEPATITTHPRSVSCRLT